MNLATTNSLRSDQQSIVFDLQQSSPLDNQSCLIVVILAPISVGESRRFQHAIGSWVFSRRDWVSLWQETNVFVLETTFAGLAVEQILWALIDQFDTPRDLIRHAYQCGLIA